MSVGIAAAELRELSDEELVERLRESKEELFNLRFQMATGQLDNNRRLLPCVARSRACTPSCGSASSAWPQDPKPRAVTTHERGPKSD